MHAIKKLLVVVAAVMFAAVAVPFSAGAQDISPVGTYEVKGTNPGGSGAYTGTVTVEQTGDSYWVTWNVGGSESAGRGVFLDLTLAVAGTLGNDGFVFAMVPTQSGMLEGVWTSLSNGTTLGTEVWTPKR